MGRFCFSSGEEPMNAADADDAVTEAREHRDEAFRLLERADIEVNRAESALFVANSNWDSAQRHYDAMDAWVAQRERVLRELTIADDGGHRP
jgi:hypothetical protein